MFDAFGILGWLVSAVGIAGVVALFVFFPVAAAAFFSSSIGRYVIVGAVIVLAFLGGRQAGTNAGHRICEAAAKQREIEIHQRDIKIGELQAKEDARIGTEQSKQEALDNEFQRKLEAELAKRPAAARCDLSPDDLRRLR